MVSPDSRLGTVGIYIQYIYITKIVVLVSEPVRGRSRATELPCYHGGSPPFPLHLDHVAARLLTVLGI